MPGGESHAGQVFTCVGALAIAGALDVCQRDLLGWWLCERQTPGGGLNGRPQKEADVCYSWWVLSSLGCSSATRGSTARAPRLHPQTRRTSDDGGIADKPGNEPDVFHTFFGIAGLAFLGADGVLPVEPMHAMPVATMERLRKQQAAAEEAAAG